MLVKCNVEIDLFGLFIHDTYETGIVDDGVLADALTHKINEVIYDFYDGALAPRI